MTRHSLRVLLGLAAWLGIIVGASASETDKGPQDATTKPAYLIAEVLVTNAKNYPAYMEAVTPLIERFGGRYIVRAGENLVPEGRPIEGRLVVIEFPDYATLLEFWNSPEYEAIKSLRTENAVSRIILADGMNP